MFCGTVGQLKIMIMYSEFPKAIKQEGIPIALSVKK